MTDELIAPAKLELGKNLQYLASRKSEVVNQKKDKLKTLLRAIRDHFYPRLEQQHLHEVTGMEESYQRLLSTSAELSNSQQLNFIKSLQNRVDAAMASNLGIHSDDSYPTSSLGKSTLRTSLLESIINLIQEELQSTTTGATHHEVVVGSSVTPELSEPEPALPVSPLKEPSLTVSPLSPPQRQPLAQAQWGDSLTLEKCGNPSYLLAFASIAPMSYKLEEGVYEVPANTPLVFYSDPNLQVVQLREMVSGVWLANYDIQGPMGLAQYGNLLFVVDNKSKCVFTIDVLSNEPATIYPSMHWEEEIFQTPSGIVVVDQYLIVMDCGEYGEPRPCLHVFDLRRRDFPFVCTISLDGVVIKTNTNPCRLSVKNDEKRSFYIFSDDTVVTCTLPVDLLYRPRSSAEQSSLNARLRTTKHLRANDWFGGFQKDQTSRPGSRVAKIPTPYSAAVHRSSDGRKLVYVSRSPIGETNRLSLYVWDADKDEIVRDKSEEISARLTTLLKGYDSPTHLCICTVPSSSTSSFLSSSSPREGPDRDQEESAYLLMTLHKTGTIISFKIN